jgi:uncharacterized protein (TIGR02391 family)
MEMIYSKSRLIQEINSKNLSEVLPHIIDYSEAINHDALRELCVNELYGYEKDSEIPDYRYIPVDFYNRYGEKISRYPKESVLSISEAMKKETYPYRGCIADLENMAIPRNFQTIISLSNPYELTINNCKYEAHSFEYFYPQIIPCISKIKKRLNQLIIHTDEVQVNPGKSLIGLHPSVINISEKLFCNHHYRQAVLDATIALVNRVKEKTQLKDLDNTPLMQKVFSANNPILRLSDIKDERQGFMWLFSGAVMIFRNLNAHSLNNNMTLEECVEQLSVISFLNRTIDKAFLSRE